MRRLIKRVSQGESTDGALVAWVWDRDSHPQIVVFLSKTRLRFRRRSRERMLTMRWGEKRYLFGVVRLKDAHPSHSYGV